MEAEMTYLLEDQARKLENAELLIERLKREVMALSFSVELHDRAAKKARAIWEEAHPDKAPEWLRREDLMVWLIERVERAEAVKDSLTSALRDIKKNVDDWNLQDYVTIRRLVNAALRTAEESSVVDSTTAKQPEGMTKLDKALQNIAIAKRILTENSCPSEFGMENHCSEDQNCEWCWSREVEQKMTVRTGVKWELQRTPYESEIDIVSDGMVIATVEAGDGKEKVAQMMAAAPDMLEALEEVVAITENLPVCPFCGAVRVVQKHRPDCLSHGINTTIKKARGKE